MLFLYMFCQALWLFCQSSFINIIKAAISLIIANWLWGLYPHKSQEHQEAYLCCSLITLSCYICLYIIIILNDLIIRSYDHTLAGATTIYSFELSGSNVVFVWFLIHKGLLVLTAAKRIIGPQGKRKLGPLLQISK
jgi:hypothetical protein